MSVTTPSPAGPISGRPRSRGRAATSTAGWSWPSSSSPTSWTCSTRRSPTWPARRSRPTSAAAQSTLQWVLAAYTMSFAIGLVISARAGDLVGRRRMFIIGMAGFTVASLLCGLAPTAGAADRVPGPAGALRRGDDPAGAGDGEAVLPPRRPAEGVHPVRPDHGAGRGARPDPGRLPARRRPVRHRLADDLPDQRAGRAVVGTFLAVSATCRTSPATPRRGWTWWARCCWPSPRRC